MNEDSVRSAPLTASPSAATTSGGSSWLLWTAVLALVYVLVVAVDVIGRGFSAASGGAEGAERIFAFAANPVLGVILGTLATALAQSSSMVSSVIVGLVAGGLPIGIAVPIIMGANMGTTVTNTIVSLGNLRDGPAFNRSFAAATVHHTHLPADRGRLPPPRKDGGLSRRDDRRRGQRLDGERQRRTHGHSTGGQRDPQPVQRDSGPLRPAADDRLRHRPGLLQRPAPAS